MEKVVILGDGAWGTALALVLVERGASVVLWSHSPEQGRAMQRERLNRRYLPGVPIPPEVSIVTDTAEFEDADLCLSVIPSRYLRGAIAPLGAALPPGVPVVSATKGLEFPGRARPSEILRQVLGDRPLAVLSGPSHAEEVARRLPTAVVAASSDSGLALRVQDLLTTERFRVYTSNDPTGVELGGALKNVLAIAGGLVDGLSLGDNAKAALLTRGQAEMTRLGVALGGQAITFSGLSGIGDLVVSCTSRHGRNRLVGERIGAGESLEQVLHSIPGVPEGVLTSKAVVELSDELRVEMPISREIHAVLYEDKNPLRAVADLMTRSQKEEVAAVAASGRARAR